MSVWSLAQFVRLDWIVLSGYFALLVTTGLWLARRRPQVTTDDYFLGGRNLPAWAAAASVMATSLSAATFIGVPEQSYAGDLTYLSSYLGLVVASFVVAVLFIPAFYRANVTTVYELLTVRCGRAAMMTASAMFMVGRTMASGARLFIGALAGALILFGNTEPASILTAIGALVVVGIVYTFIGGIAAVVWADVIQSAVFVGAALVAIALLLAWIPADMSQILEALRAPGGGEGSKLRLFEPGLAGLGAEHTFSLLSILVGFTLLGIGSYGTDQDLTQRMLTCRSARSGAFSAIAGIAASVPVAFLFMAAGLLLWVFYQRPDLMGAAAPATVPEMEREVFVVFVLAEMPPGIAGLMMAGLFAAALSSLNSELNAMSSTLINDFYRPLVPRRPPRHYVRAGRAGVVGWGLALGGFAALSAHWQRAGDETLIEFALGVMTFAYSGLVAVFLTVLLTPRGSTRSVIAALATGFLAVLVLRTQPWTRLGWEPLDLAFTWQMGLATLLAFLVCCLGRPPGRS